MEEQNNSKQEENCPLCEISKQAVDKLDLNQGSKTSSRRSFWKSRVVVCTLVIILGAFAGYKFLLNSSPGLIQGGGSKQSAETVLAKPQIGSFAPDFISEDIYGVKVALSGFRDKKPVVLVFWATWCGYCAKELEDLKTFTQKYQDRVQVIAVDSGESKDVIKNYTQEKRINFLMLLDQDMKIWNQYLVRGTPSHFFIDKQGKIVGLRPGLSSLANLEIMLTKLR